MENTSNKVVHANFGRTTDLGYIKTQLELFIQAGVKDVFIVFGKPLSDIMMHAEYSNHNDPDFREKRRLSVHSQLDEIMAIMKSNIKTHANPIILPIANIEGITDPQMLVLMDIDDHGTGVKGIDSYKILQKKYDIPKTLTVKTPTGYHLYFYIPVDKALALPVSAIQQYVDGIDLLTSNDPNKNGGFRGPGYHRKLKNDEIYRYHLHNENKIQPLPIQIIDDILSSEDYSRAIKHSTSAYKKILAEGIALDQPDNIRKAEAYFKSVASKIVDKGKIKEGRRDHEINNFSFKCASYGLSESEVIRLVLKFNSKYIENPWSVSAIESKVKHAYKDRLGKSEISINADHSMPEFEPYAMDRLGRVKASIKDVYMRANLFTGNRIADILTSDRAINAFADTCFFVDKSFFRVRIPNVIEQLSEVSEHLNGKIRFSQIREYIDDIGINYSNPQKVSDFNVDVGKVQIETSKGTSDIRLTEHPVFLQRMLSNMSVVEEQNSQLMINGNKFNMIYPHPFEFTQRLNELEMERALPEIENIFNVFDGIVTDQQRPEEMEYLKHWLSAIMNSDKELYTFLVIQGDGDAGKTAFSELISLLLHPKLVTMIERGEDLIDKYQTKTTLNICDEAEELLRIRSAKDKGDNPFETIKRDLTSTARVGEKKFVNKYTVTGKINYMLLTNPKVLNSDFLTNRRCVIFGAKSKYNRDELTNKLYNFAEWLIADNMFGYRAFYQYVKDIPTQGYDWKFRTYYGSQLLNEIETLSDDELAANSNIGSNAGYKAKINANADSMAMILNALFNLGIMSDDIKDSQKSEKQNGFMLPICTHREEFKKAEELDKDNEGIYGKMPCTAIDIAYMFRYYSGLESKMIYMPNRFRNEFSAKDDNSLRIMLKNLTHNAKISFGDHNYREKTVLMQIVGDLNIDTKRKKIPKLKHISDNKTISQGQAIFVNPLADWVKRFNLIFDDLASESNSRQRLEVYKAYQIVAYLDDCVENNYEPSYDERVKKLKEIFPDEIPGEISAKHYLAKFNDNGLAFKDESGEDDFLD